MANISNNAYRSRLSQTAGSRPGPQGFHKNPGDFSERSGSKFATRQTLMQKHWEYLPEGLRSRINAASTTFRGVSIEGSQFLLTLG